MFKRLSISLLLMGLAAFSLGAAAFAWFSDSEVGNVTIQTGDTNIAVEVDRDCNGPEGTIDGTPTALSWPTIVPGDTTRDCFVVHNEGDGDLDVYVRHTAISAPGALLAALPFTYDDNDNPADGDWCGPLPANDAAFVSDNTNRGCFVGTVLEGQSLPFEVRVEFTDNGNQNNLQNSQLTMTATVTGYTGP